MGKVVSVASGKGGVGKSTFCCHLGRALAELGKSTVILEMDSGLRGLDIMLGVADSLYDFSDFVNNRCTLKDATLHVPNCPKLFLISAPVQYQHTLTPQQFYAICGALKSKYDYVLVDASAGYVLTNVMPRVSDLICVIVTADPLAVRDAEVFVDTIRQFEASAPIRLIVNKISKETIKGRMVNDLDQVIDQVGVQLLGVLPESQEIWNNTSKGFPLKATGVPIKIFQAIANRIDGKHIPLVLRSL